MAEPDRGRPLVAILTGAAIVLAFFWRFALPALFMGFAEDDPMNLQGYWSAGPVRLARGLILFFTSDYRPMGGVFYMILYGVFGMDPRPYHAAILALLLLNAFLAYRFVSLLSGSRLAGGLCALVVAYHPRLAHLAYMTSFVYDVLCFTFYFSALAVYVSARRRGGLLSRRRLAAFLLFYVAALQSKEIAVTLPLAVLFYELVWHPPPAWRWSGVRRWLSSEALPALAAAAITAVFIVGKLSAPNPLTTNVLYAPILSFRQFAVENTKYLNQLFHSTEADGFFVVRRTFLLWAVLLFIAVLRKDKVLAWASLLAVAAPLPIAFLPNRGGGCLYIPLAIWALIAGWILLTSARTVARLPLVRRAPAAAIATVAALAGAAGYWWITEAANRGTEGYFRSAVTRTDLVLTQMATLQIRPGSSVLILNDVFPEFDTKFIAELAWGDRSVTVRLQHKDRLPPHEIARVDHILTFERGMLKQLRP